jgi:signal recognition particle receptor subunit beta
MVFFNYALRKLNAKIVYYGPGLCGKTTNLQWIHDHFEGGQRGKMISLATEGDRTIFFDLLPIDIGTIRGMDVTLQLYTVPGQVHYNSTRQLVLRGADGVVFVADSQRTMRASNAESFENLQENLMLQGIDLKDFPHILQFNKRDLRDLLSIEDLNESLNIFSTPIFEAIATEGIGVQESLEGIVKLVMRNLREKYEPVASAAGPQPLSPMRPPGPMTFPSAPPPPARPVPQPPGPMAPDFVTQSETPPPVDRPAAGAPTFDSTANETKAVDRDVDFPAFHDEDHIPTAVYEPDNEEIAAHEAALEHPAAADGEPAFAPAEDGAAFVPPAERADHFGGLFTDPRDEDGTSDAGSPPAATADVEDSDTADEMVTDPAIRIDSEEAQVLGADDDGEWAPPEESIDDLFESEVPSVKAFMDDVPDVVEIGGEAGDVYAPPSVDQADMMAGTVSADHYEDRIEAPGPFAPPPSAFDEPAASESDKAERDAEAVHAEVRQALGASEDREALASLSMSDDVAVDAAIDGLTAPPEVRRVTPPPPVAPDVTEPVASFEETPAASFGDAGAGAAAEIEESRETASVTREPEPPAPAIEVSAPVDAPTDESGAEAPAVEPAAADRPPAEAAAPSPADEAPPAKSRPIMFGVGDPFSDADALVPEVVPRSDSTAAMRRRFDVTAEGNQLHLQLRGSGAIAEMGQVRALDIEVPVPGQWVGNRKVTLQLRLTLTPAEDEND